MLSQFNILGEILIATFERGVFGFRLICASNGEILVTPCGVILNDWILSATSEASLYGVFVSSTFITASQRFNVCIILSTNPIALWSSTGANSSFIC